MTISSWRSVADRAAIGLSLACAVHCLALPLLIVALPALSAMGLADEAFHEWLILLVVPISAFALIAGCRRHRSVTIPLVGLAGLLLLGAPIALGHEVVGEFGERALTLLGSATVALSHWWNFKRCR